MTKETQASVWHSQKMPEAMMSTCFPHIVRSDHFRSLKICFDNIKNAKTLIDLGCGKAEVAEAFPEYEYLGADLPHIIQNVSKKTRTLLEYIEFDALIDSMDFISKYDVVLMNGFLSEIPQADFVLNKVLSHAKNYVIVHRQAIGENQQYEPYSTYGGMSTVRYTFAQEKFKSIVQLNGFSEILNIQSIGNLRSLVLKRL
jgi:hypothetical protein